MERVLENNKDNSQLDMMRHSSIIDPNDSMSSVRRVAGLSEPIQSSIFNLFFGKMTQILRVRDEANQGKIKDISRIDEKMGPIMLDVGSHGSLEEAWNATLVEVIEDYDSKEVAESFYVRAKDRMTVS